MGPLTDVPVPLNKTITHLSIRGMGWGGERESEVIVKYVFINVRLTLHKMNDPQITVH